MHKAGASCVSNSGQTLCKMLAFELVGCHITKSATPEGRLSALTLKGILLQVVESSDSDACMDTADPQDEVASCHATSPEKARVEAKGSEAEARGQSNKGSIFEGSQAFGKPPGRF